MPNRPEISAELPSVDLGKTRKKKRNKKRKRNLDDGNSRDRGNLATLETPGSPGSGVSVLENATADQETNNDKNKTKKTQKRKKGNVGDANVNNAKKHVSPGTMRNPSKSKPPGSRSHRHKHTRPCVYSPVGCGAIDTPEHLEGKHEPNCRFKMRGTRELEIWGRLLHFVKEEGISPDPAKVLGPRQCRNIQAVPEYSEEQLENSSKLEPFTYPLQVAETQCPTEGDLVGKLKTAAKEKLGDKPSKGSKEPVGNRYEEQFQQLHKPKSFSQADVICCFNVRETRSAQRIYRAPDWMEPEDLVHNPVTGGTWNITPAKTFTDLHTDDGGDTTSWPVGGCKIWLFWPPNWEDGEGKHHWKVWTDIETHPELAKPVHEPESTMFEKNSNMLWGTRMAITEGNDRALFIPAGWRHVVYTLEGGYLGGLIAAPEHKITRVVGLLAREFKELGPEVNPATGVRLPIEAVRTLSSMADSVLRCLDSALSTHPDEAVPAFHVLSKLMKHRPRFKAQVPDFERRWEKIKRARRGLAN